MVVVEDKRLSNTVLCGHPHSVATATKTTQAGHGTAQHKALAIGTAAPSVDKSGQARPVATAYRERERERDRRRNRRQHTCKIVRN